MQLAMWSALSFCLLALVLTSEWVSGEHQRLHHDSADHEGPTKERRIDKMPPCVHDEIAEKNPYIVDLASQNLFIEAKKRQISPTYANIRIHPELVSVASSAIPYLQGPDSILSRSIKTLESILMVHPVQGNLRIPPMCTEYTSGVNKGKCRSPLPSQSSYDCGDFGTIPLSYIGVREVCTSYYSSSSCTTQGPNGVGLPNADYLLFVSASSSTWSCLFGALAHASYCVLDSSDNNRPVVGCINMCPSFLVDYAGSTGVIYSVIMHEIIHALGFSSRLYEYFVTDAGIKYNASKTVTGPYGSIGIFTGPKTLEVAKSYYSCEDMEGVALENEGGSGTASSHWDKRTLNNEVMTGYLSRDYQILSEFTIALLEDSGWYKGNYTALSALNQLPLQWGKDLGCAFLTERCVNESVYPYLCDASSDEVMCTYDHLSKGTCSTRWAGFDDCPVLLADEPEHFCRTELDVTLENDVESYSSNSICVDGLRSLSSSSCGTYTNGSALPLCVAQESFTINDTNQYVVYLEDSPHGCEDGVALATADNWVVSCPPTEDIVSRSPVIMTELPDLSPSNEIDYHYKHGNFLAAKNRDLVAFGGIKFDSRINVLLQITSLYNFTTPVCHLYGCTSCFGPSLVGSSVTRAHSGDRIYLASIGRVVATAVLSLTGRMPSDYSLILMMNPFASHSFVYYAASVDFVGDHLQQLHSNDQTIIQIIALTNSTEVRIAPNIGIEVNKYAVQKGEEYITTLDVGESVMITSSEDLTGSRVTANKAISFYSGHYCATGSTDNCSVLTEQIPPFNSWGNSFILHTTVIGLIGNMFKLISSDIGASVSINCTSDGINYESNNYHLGFRQHLVLSITHHHCIVNSDENILIIQFKDSSQSPLDTFMTIIPAIDQFEDYYVMNTNNSYVVLTVVGSNPNIIPILLDDNPATVSWEVFILNESAYYYGVLQLPSGRHTLTFLEGVVKFGAIIYGSSGTDTYALPAGMKLDLVTDLPSQPPSPVQDAVLTLVDGIINVTWTPPVVPNGIIYQYIVQRVNSSGKFYHHVPANQNTTLLAYFNSVVVFVAAVNLYGQGVFELAVPTVPCQPSPCINGGNCSVVNTNNQATYFCTCSEMFFGQFCEKSQKLYQFGPESNDITLLKTSSGYSSVLLSEDFVFYGAATRQVYVNANGVISLGGRYTTSTPRSLPLTGTYKIIAPYWADVDTRGTGNIYYRQTTDPILLARATSEIRAAYPMSQNLTITNMFIATWDSVGYYYRHTDKTNTFQCILATSGVESFVVFLYADGRIQWTTGDFSGGDDGLGGTEALAGINAGDGENFITIPGSLTPSIINITQTTNVGIPGMWIFRVDHDVCEPSVGTCISEFYPFGFLHNDTALPEPSVGEGSSPPITLSDGFHFYDEIIRTIYINDNGVISFGSRYNVRTPLSFPLNGTNKIIAPYWADVDTRGIGQVFYRQTTDPSLLARATSEIRAAFSNSQNVTITDLLIATWDNVGYYYRKSDKTNTFQCVLATSGVESFVIFLYADGRIEWTTGDNSGGYRGLYGTEALAGINGGDGFRFVTIPGSLTTGIINIDRTTNVGTPGVWMFRVDTEIDDCQLDTHTCLSEFYPFGFVHNDSALPRPYIGEGSSPAITLAEVISFFDETARIVYINDNGVISFGSRYNVRTPLSFPLSGNNKIIAPYWADVDTRGTGNIYYRQTTDSSLLARATSEIRAAFPESRNVTIKNLLIATWYKVGYYYQNSDKTNTFQCVLATSGVESFVIFLYADGRIQWTTGSNSGGSRGLGGTEALAGINAGDGVHVVTIPGSQTPSIINITQTSNIGIPGIWMFSLRAVNGCEPENKTCLSEFYPYGDSHGDTSLRYPYIGEGSSSVITLSQEFVFYGQVVRTAYVNDNGVISFGSRYNVRTPLSFPLSRSDKIIAPYWADVDTRGTGDIYYRQTTDPSLLARATNEIRAAFPTSQNVTITNLLIATWDKVGYYYQKTDKTNTFQCVLATSGVESFVMFLYADGRIQWTTGDNSGGFRGLYGTEALAGINAGDGENFETVPGSRTSGIINVQETSNIGIPGMWMFQINKVLVIDDCLPGRHTCLSEFYPFGLTHNDVTLPTPYLGEGSSPAITLADTFHFFDEIVRVVYINDNGVISFGSRYNVRTPLSLPLSENSKIIAPYWADVDTRGTGNIYYRQTTDSSLLARATSEIRAAFPMSQNVTIQNLLIATWYRVGYYYQSFDKTNTFQCVLATSGVESFAIFLYADERMQWTTGSNSGGFRGLGGTEALAGVNAGDGYNSYTIPGSQTPSIINITQTSNVGIPGVWMYNLKSVNACETQNDATCVSEFYPFGNDNGDAVLPYPSVGEGSSPSITLSEDFVFFNQVVRTTYVNDNGVISFGSRYNVRTPLSLPLSGSNKIIAPYWADVDTRGTGDIYYRQTTDPSLLARATSEIRTAFPRSLNNTISNLLIATWDRVGYYYRNTDKTNTFQCVLATSGVESFVIFLYAVGRIQWTTGSNSGGYRGLGGTEALAGINAGDGYNSYTIPGSQTPSIINITQTSNVGLPGIWIYNFKSVNACETQNNVTCVSEFYPFGNDNGDAVLPYPSVGEGSSPPITLSEDFVFFNQVVRTTYVNDNGVISFGSRYNVRTPLSLPLSGSNKIIAPYWADVDTRGTGDIYYRQTTDPSLLARATSEIRAAFPRSLNNTISNLLIATWDRVGYYYRNTDKTNTFQCVLATSGVESFVMFLYADGRIQWTTGSRSGGLGGTEALAGINGGDGENFVTIPGSRTSSIINIDKTSNIGVPGVWIFKVDSDTGSCQQDLRTCLSEFYSYGSAHGDRTLSYPLAGEGSSPIITLTESFVFYRQVIRTVYINDNGVISFGSRYNVRTPLSLPLSGSNKIIAPYWADVDTRGTGNIYYRQTTDSSFLARATSEIRAVFPMSQNVTITNLLIATWDRVGYYYQKTDKTNTFQCVLATSGVESFVIFLYADGRMQWTTGDNSGGYRGLYGTEALAGINAGDGVNFVTIPGSRTSSIINIDRTSNIGISGVWMFSLASGIIADDCQPDINTCISEFYPFGFVNNDTALLALSFDANSPQITLSEDFYFYDDLVRTAYISDNGVVSFNNTFSLYTPRSLPLNGTNKIIAPYWADVDITGTGNIYYRQTTDSSLLARATSEIRAAFSMSQNFMAKHLLIVTWNAVGYYYRNTDKTNTFQCVLATSGVESFVILLYAGGRIKWTTGDRSGGSGGIYGTKALAGINAGDRFRFVTIPGSLTSGIIYIDQTTNVGIPGVWIFRVDTEIDDCQLNTHTCLSEFYPFGFVHNDSVLIKPNYGEGSSPAITLAENISFFDETVRIVYINENGVLSFGSRFEIHTPLSFPLGGINNKIIAPYWADVDTGGIGNIYYRQTTDPSILTRATSEIKAAFPMSQNVTIKNLLIATWYKVGYFVENADKTNTFQCVLATSEVESFVIFLYADGRIQWTTGGRSRGREALAGINGGDGFNFVTIPGSQTPSIINITQTSNVGIPGIWMYSLRTVNGCEPENKTCLSEFYPYGNSNGDTSLPVGEGSSSVITLSQDFVFYGQVVRTAYVNDNGVISFNSRYNVRTPLSLPLSSTDKIIAPYWADVDTTGTGDIYYRQTTDPSLLARATSEIRAAIPTSQNVTITDLLIATWDRVGYAYRQTNKINTFQCVLATSGVESFVIFLYADGRIQWTTGDSSDGFRGLGGTEALAGIDAGDGENFITIPGSLTSDIINIHDTSNIGIPGMWMFQVNRVLVFDDCLPERHTCLSEFYPFGLNHNDSTLPTPYLGEGSSPAIILADTYHFFDDIVKVIYINDNGVISFRSRYNVRTPLSLPLSGTDKIIAPYWADVDTRGSGAIYYRQTTDPSLLARATSEIRAALLMSQNATIQSLLIATWYRVGYIIHRFDKTNTFQCVLATSGVESFVIFLYADGRIQWTTGYYSGGDDGLGGTEALAGINAGDGHNSYTIPGSQTPSIVNITQTSNVGLPGVWIYNLKSVNACDTQNNVTCVSEFYPFGNDSGDAVLPYPSDSQGTSPSITLSEDFVFFNQVVRTTYIHDNGVISFGSHYNVCTPMSLPLDGTDKIIAPYWADVDTRGTGNIYYRQTTDPNLLARATSEIGAAFPTSLNNTISNLLIATWDRVGYYNNGIDKTNTFQCILATSGVESFVIFLYADGRIQWTTGDNSGGDDGLGGTEALAGINAGDGYNSYTIPGSQTPSIINITQTSNVGIPGVWIFNLKPVNACETQTNVTCVSEFYSFGNDSGDAVLPYPSVGEGSSPSITLSEDFVFYNQVVRTTYVNDNGVISFGSRYNVRTPLSFPLSGSNKIIAPYWADVDTRGTGDIYYRQTTDPSLLARATSEIRAAFPMSFNNTISNLLIATWDRVGYYNNGTDKTNTFQCVLATSGVESFVMFLYADERIQWTTGSDSGGSRGIGGTEALVGINGGDYEHFVTIPGSRTSRIINIDKTSNIGVPGVWIFKVDSDGCQQELRTCVSEFYSYGFAHGDSTLPYPLDGQGRSPLITLTESVVFYRQVIRTVYINDNGVISFGSGYSIRTPRSLPLIGPNKIIAPYWADVDTRGIGNIYYRQTTDPSLLARATSEIRAVFPMSQNVTITNLLIATWVRVGYYSQNTQKTNTFQCVLATSALESFVIFLYADGRIEWTTGSSSGGFRGLGGTEALAGINYGDGVNFVTIPGSRTSSIINIDKTSNVGISGVWMFKLGSGISADDCQPDINTCISEFYPFGFVNNDTALLTLYSNANSPPITLSEDFYFYDDLVRTAYDFGEMFQIAHY
ncbi:uncharacterized protein [Dysidea avara]|uniref:uncharacterized protein isoform X3 n=1 Tax=Dysidea avara TaxID=196820 RepID=UPI00331B14F8